jgi:hypothetical protein
MNSQDLTVVMPARNAAATIGRAIASVTSLHVLEIVLVDHASIDGTSEVARAHACRPLRIITAAAEARLGGVRQRALESVTTTYGLWLDADDEFLPGRVERLRLRLAAGADLATDAVELQEADGARRMLTLPAFLQRPGGWVRLFERNYLPGPGVVGFRTQSLLATGYDPVQHGPEDTDALLRALDAGARLDFEPIPGYRIHALPTSLSRDQINQRAMYRTLLSKHDPAHVHARYLEAGWPERVAWWARQSMALFKDDLEEAERCLGVLAELRDGVDRDAVAEPDGPQPFPEGWRLDFATGTLALLRRRDREAVSALQRAADARACAEGVNNLGVAMARCGQLTAARLLFAEAVALRSGYIDALLNLREPEASHITSHPFRVHDNRIAYLAPQATPQQTLEAALRARPVEARHGSS